MNKKIVGEIHSDKQSSNFHCPQSNPVHHDKMKHIEVDKHFTKKRTDTEVIYVSYCWNTNSPTLV